MPVQTVASPGLEQIAVLTETHSGTKRDAILYSVGANAAHGQRRTNADKRKAVMTLLEDAEWSQWSAEEIARRCCVSASLVKSMRGSLDTKASDQPTTRTYTNKHGTTSTMDTSNIGKTRTNTDKRKAVMTLLEDAEWSGFSNE